jgi:hypothetical protein
MEKQSFSFWSMLAALTVLLSAFGVTAYNSGLAPNVLGHTSDEISFQFQSVETDCTDDTTSTLCTASCSVWGSDYRAMGGSCISYEGSQWAGMGLSTDGVSWQCWDFSHYPGQTYLARAWCARVG